MIQPEMVSGKPGRCSSTEEQPPCKRLVAGSNPASGSGTGTAWWRQDGYWFVVLVRVVEAPHGFDSRLSIFHLYSVEWKVSDMSKYCTSTIVAPLQGSAGVEDVEHQCSGTDGHRLKDEGRVDGKAAYNHYCGCGHEWGANGKLVVDGTKS